MTFQRKKSMTSSMTRSAVKVSGGLSARPSLLDRDDLMKAAYSEFVTLLQQWFSYEQATETWVSFDGMVALRYTGKRYGYVLADFTHHRGFKGVSQKAALFAWITFLNTSGAKKLC
jgi:hypothetical protein